MHIRHGRISHWLLNHDHHVNHFAFPPRAAELVPSGKLRAAINFGNPILANKDAATGEARGVSVDLARDLGKRLGMPVELVIYTAAGKVVEGIKSGE